MLSGDSGPYPYETGEYLIIDLLVYSDDSKIPDSPYLVLAGYIAGPNQWELFKTAWTGVLTDFDVPAFHAKDFFPRKLRGDATENPYRGWDDDKAVGFLDALLSAIDELLIYPIGCAVNLPAFNALPHDERRYFTGAQIDVNTRTDKPPIAKFKFSGAPKRPYRMLFDGVIFEAIDWSKECVLPEELSSIHFYFDRQGTLEAGAIAHFHELAKSNFRNNPGTDRLGGITFGKMAVHKPLQAADLFAYIWNARLTYGELRGERALAWDRLTSFRPCKLEVYEAEHFPAMLEHLHTLIGEQVLATVKRMQSPP
jgi:hypothetical protein